MIRKHNRTCLRNNRRAISLARAISHIGSTEQNKHVQYRVQILHVLADPARAISGARNSQISRKSTLRARTQNNIKPKQQSNRLTATIQYDQYDRPGLQNNKLKQQSTTYNTMDTIDQALYSSSPLPPPQQSKTPSNSLTTLMAFNSSQVSGLTDDSSSEVMNFEPPAEK